MNKVLAVLVLISGIALGNVARVYLPPYLGWTLWVILPFVGGYQAGSLWFKESE